MSTDGKALTTVREVRVVENSGPQSYLMDTALFEHSQRVAVAMSNCSLIPDHLKSKSGSNAETVANCFLVVNQAILWEVNPFALAAETYVVKGKLGYQGKLIAAIVNKHAGLASPLRYAYTGKGDGREITVTGRLQIEDFDREIKLSVGQAKTDNQMWTRDPDQKLIYSGVTKWARAHCPGVILGILTDDDVDHVVKSKPTFAEMVAPKKIEAIDWNEQLARDIETAGDETRCVEIEKHIHEHWQTGDCDGAELLSLLADRRATLGAK